MAQKLTPAGLVVGLIIEEEAPVQEPEKAPVQEAAPPAKQSEPSKHTRKTKA